MNHISFLFLSLRTKEETSINRQLYSNDASFNPLPLRTKEETVGGGDVGNQSQFQSASFANKGRNNSGHRPW
ncbi:hypothetical protein LEP1GSC170_5789 [Leptospira interrogans serovar Bataviae str. HAI135]|nr:hypothetical protein LEP1GSC170_5789 [Leptospira interrogans serovar Bataviae str. HAI135]